MAFWVVGPGSASNEHNDGSYYRDGSVKIADLAYLVIHEEQPRDESPRALSPNHTHGQRLVEHQQHNTNTNHKTALYGILESTASGLPVSSALASSLTGYEDRDKREGRIIGDLEAAQVVRSHVLSSQRRNADSKHARILRALINPRYGPSSVGNNRGDHGSEAFHMDEDALQSLFSTANELFFANKLSRRVTWDWSDSSSTQFEDEIVGTTALRRSRNRDGWETLMILSSQVLRDPRYNRRLLIATFLHEMIHSFLYVMCGLQASRDGGHTEGFRLIAQVLDEWIGRDYLRLGDMEADLEYFENESTTHSNSHGVQGCFRRSNHGQYSPWSPHNDTNTNSHNGVEYSHEVRRW